MLIKAQEPSDEDGDSSEGIDSTKDSLMGVEVTKEIEQALHGLQYGEVTLTVRDGRIVQIERIVRSRQLHPKNP